jgi:hypothetical protein
LTLNHSGPKSTCPHCGLSSAGEPETSCPNCGVRLPAPDRKPSDALMAPFKSYFGALWRILTRPTEFFRRMPIRGGMAWPLAFALITHWIGQAGQFLWQASIGAAFSEKIAPFFRLFNDVADVDHPGRSAMLMQMRDRVWHWIMGAGSVIADPFITLAGLLFTSFFVFVGARLLVTPRRDGAPSEITYESALRIVCFGTCPAILAVIPVGGPLLAMFFTWIVTVIGAKQVYRVPWGRATVVGLFPKVLLAGIMLLGLFFVMIALTKMMLSVFA